MAPEIFEKRLAELKTDIIQGTAIINDVDARHASIKADIYDRIHDIILKVDPDRARRAAADLLEKDNDILLSYIADPFLIRTPILSTLNKIKQTENKAKLVEQNKSATSPQDVSALDRGDRANV